MSQGHIREQPSTSKPKPSANSTSAPRTLLGKRQCRCATESSCRICAPPSSACISTSARATRCPRTNGLAHLFEHMVFKGTPKHDALDIVQGFEATGGQVNAYTSKEQTCFYAKVVDTEVHAGLSMLLDMVLNSKFDPADLHKEKDVIIEEIKGGNDNPEDYVYDLFSKAVFDTHSLGFPIAGNEKTVKGLTRQHLLDHQLKAAKTLPVFVTAVGSVNHDEVVAIVRKAFKLPAKASGKGAGSKAPSRSVKADAPAFARKSFQRPGTALRPRT